MSRSAGYCLYRSLRMIFSRRLLVFPAAVRPDPKGARNIPWFHYPTGLFRDPCDAQLPVLQRDVLVSRLTGVLTMTENHGFFSQDSDRVEKLYTAVNHPNFALLCDMGNFMCADENPALAVARVAPYTRYVHAKDFIWRSYNDADPGEGAFQTRAGNYLRGTIVGHGNVPVKQCLHILKAAGYDGTIAIGAAAKEILVATGIPEDFFTGLPLCELLKLKNAVNDPDFFG